mmetsp:Transcript_14890/g.29950  ORF Transcript_14890/g.29950 Transcript_14890/m.29950 type:complete len:526 (+) Transcript_14890:374-1951(+)
MATQRKNKAPAQPQMEAAPPSPLPPPPPPPNHQTSPSKLVSKSPGVGVGSGAAATAATVATVRRRNFGTSPFDRHWLNLDCCGLFCAGLTYSLHLYGCYAVCVVLLPPWMSYVYDPDGSVVPPSASVVDGAVRKLSYWGVLHSVAFCAVAAMAVLSHLKAMMTDPGAVPPDAAPLPHPDDVAGLLEGGGGGAAGAGANGNGSGETSRLLGSSGTGTGGTASGDAGSAGATVAAAAATAAAAAGGAAAAVAAAPALAAGAAVASAMPKKPPSAQTTKTPAPRGRRICRRCNAYKPRRAHHCSVCKRCIIKMDYHCPWVNNCVGIGNHKYFLLFVFYTFMSCTYSLTLVVTRFVQCLGVSRLSRGQCLDEPEHILNLVGLIVEALLFGLFTCCMMVDQWDVVMTNVTHIDRLKGETGFGFLDDSSRMLGINEVFGSGRAAAAAAGGQSNAHLGGGISASHFRPDWLSPFVRVCFPPSVHDEIMGFCRPCGGMSRAERAKKEDDDDLELRAGRGPALVYSVVTIIIVY